MSSSEFMLPPPVADLLDSLAVCTDPDLGDRLFHRAASIQDACDRAIKNYQKKRPAMLDRKKRVGRR